MTLGLYIGRLNPPHFGHLQTIEMMLEENQENILFLGSSDKSDENNPLSFSERKDLISEIFFDEGLSIVDLEDNPSDKKWLQSIVSILDTYYPGRKDITFYGGDFVNDSAYKVFQEYSSLLSGYNINYRENSRENSFIEKDGKKYDLSGTNFRKFLDENKIGIAQQFTDKRIFSSIEKKVGEKGKNIF